MSETKTTDATVAPTEMVYLTYEGNFLLECESEILAVESDEAEPKSLNLVLNKTVMHAQGGGQPTDTGVITVVSSSSGIEKGIVDVEKVSMDRGSGIATHKCRLREGDTFLPGDKAMVVVNKESRQILSECHTAGHVVDSAMDRCGKLLKPSKAYHFLDSPYVEYHGNIPVDERASLLDKLKEAFNDLVNEDIETKIIQLSKPDAKVICSRVGDDYFNLDSFGDDDLRIVTVAGWPCPCGGTHVKSTGELKSRKWGITGLKSKKGVVRVKYGQT